MEVEALLHALAQTLAEIEPEKFDDTLAEVEVIGSTIGQLKTDILVDKLSDVQAEPLVDTVT